MSDTCPTCRGAVTVRGETTLHYEPDLDAMAMVAVDVMVDDVSENGLLTSRVACAYAGCVECRERLVTLLVAAWTR